MNLQNLRVALSSYLPTSASYGPNSWVRKIYTSARHFAYYAPYAPIIPGPIIPTFLVTVTFEQFPKEIQDMIVKIAYIANSTLSNAQEVEQFFTKESLRVFNYLNQALNWEFYAFSYLPTSVKLGLILLMCFVTYRVLFPHRSGSTQNPIPNPIQDPI